VGADPVCVAGECAQHESYQAGSGSCDASSSSYTKTSLTEVDLVAQGYTVRIVVQQHCASSGDGHGGSQYARSTIVDAYTRAPDGFERDAAAGWYSYEQTTPFGTYGDCAIWTQTRNVQTTGPAYADYGCPAGEPPGIVLP
jgi:hypothetical protein